MSIKKTPTPRQVKVISLLIEEYSKKSGKRKTLGQILLEADYSPNVAKNPHMVLDSETIQDGLNTYLESINKKKKSALKHITEKKLEESNARDCAYITDVLNKNSLLLGGQATERKVISVEEKGKIDQILATLED